MIVFIDNSAENTNCHQYEKI